GWVRRIRRFLGSVCTTPDNGDVSGNKPPDPSNPGGSKKSGVALQVKLPCAILDDVRTRHPELSTRRFFLRTANPRPIETPIRLIATLSDGKHCFRANAIVEKVHAAGEGPVRDSGMTLWLARMDDPGRELVAWMGGQPPPLLKQPAAPEAAVLAPPAPPPPPPGAIASPGALPPPSNWSVESRRPAPPPLPRPTLAPGAAQTPSPQPVDESDELPSARPTKPSGAIIGIDLGTTNSCAAVVKDGKPFVIPSREGYNTMPSVVALSDKGKLMVGHPARSQLLI